ncbi:MAG: NfeD family protein [Granulosicoccaceae bacterium]
MMEALTAITYWHWLALGFGLMILEILSFTAILLWAGAGAFVTALLAFVAPETSWQLQTLCFALSTVLLLCATRAWLYKRDQSAQPSTLNRRADGLIGKEHVIDEPIVHGQGRLNIHDTLWVLRGPDAPAGTGIKIVAVEDNTLLVEIQPK